MTAFISGEPQRPPREFLPRVGGEPSLPPRQLLVEVRENACVGRRCIMTCSRRFYVVGPPTPSRVDIPGLLHVVLSKTNVIQTEHMMMTTLEDPIPFHSAWTPGGRQKILRPGMTALQLWTGTLSWPDTVDVRSLSVIVKDYNYINQPRDKPKLPPTFETFIVSLLRDDQPGVRSIYIWNVVQPPQTWWKDRATWLTGLHDDSIRRRSALEQLRGASWQALHDLEVIFTPLDSVRLSRRATRSSKRNHRPDECYEVESTPRRDDFVPDGLHKFVASVCRRPSSYDQLCRMLWEYHIRGATHTSFDVWYHDTCTMKHVKDIETIRKWWWKSIIAIASSTVKQLQDCVDNKHIHRIQAAMVTGLGVRHYKALGVEPWALVQDCRNHRISFPVVNLGSGKNLIVRGVCTGGYMFLARILTHLL